jgi:CRISPR-associated protein Csx17
LVRAGTPPILAALGLLKGLVATLARRARRLARRRAAHRRRATRPEALADTLMIVAEEASWTTYGRGWADAQKASTKAESGAKPAQWQAQADENELELFAAHAAPVSRVYFNPLRGSGGNAGKRAFADGWKKAIEALRTPSKPKRSAGANSDDRRVALLAFLDGDASTWQAGKLNAAS